MKIGLATATTLATLLLLTSTSFADEADATNTNEAKAEEPKVEEPKVEEPKAEAPKAEATRADAPAPAVEAMKPVKLAPIFTPPPNVDRPLAPPALKKAEDTQSGVVATFVASRPMQLGSSGNVAERSCASLGGQCNA